jgi:dipeptidyl aminopeptidase/acylaminoacyl peptidase
LVQFLIQRGFGVLAPNFRGSSGYGRSFSELARGHSRWDAARDIAAAGQWLLAQQYGRTGKLAVIGENYGGFLALGGAEAAAGLYGAAVTAGAWLNLANAWLGFAPIWRAYLQAEFGEMRDLAFLKSISPVARASTLNTPALLFTAAGDSQAPTTDAEELAKAARAQQTPIELKNLSAAVRPQAPTRWGAADLSALAYFIDAHLKTGNR